MSRVSFSKIYTRSLILFLAYDRHRACGSILLPRQLIPTQIISFRCWQVKPRLPSLPLLFSHFLLPSCLSLLLFLFSFLFLLSFLSPSSPPSPPPFLFFFFFSCYWDCLLIQLSFAEPICSLVASTAALTCAPLTQIPP